MHFARRLHHSLPPLALALLLGACAGTPPREARLPPSAPAPSTANLAPARADVVFTAFAMVGKPYRYGGESPSEGFDCSGLVFYSYRNAGIDVPRTTRAQLDALRRTDPRNLQPGDLIFFRFGRLQPSHVGIYIGNDEFVHAPASGKRVRKERLDDPYWRERLALVGSYF